MTKSNNKINLNDWLRTGLLRICRIHFVLVAILSVYILASDATKLITPELVLMRWIVSALLLTGVIIIWYLTLNSKRTNNYYRKLTFTLIVLDIGLASFYVYMGRGMASRAVMLFAIPILISSVLLSRTALFLTATLCLSAYTLTAVKYFVDFFNEGYKAELYIEVGFYGAVLFVLTAILSVLIRFKNPEL